MKSSFKKLVNLPPFEAIFKNWRANILIELHYIWRGEEKELCGVAMDPALFMKQYLVRFLERREMEGSLPDPGNYRVKFKVGFIHFWGS